MVDNDRKRWLAFIVLCLGTLMIVLDSTIVNVALPSIRNDLKFTESSLAWVVNAYLLTFGGFLLLSGRLGDIFGHRRLFLVGLILFTAASLSCGLAPNQATLIIGRAIQGFGGAIVSAVSLSLTMNLFTTQEDRAKAMGLYGFVAAGGGSVGVLLGGILTGSLNWHWIFWVNVPLGIGVVLLSRSLLPESTDTGASRKLDISGAVLITSALLLAVYAVINGNTAGWLSLQTLGLLAVAVVLILGFIRLESRVQTPLVNLEHLKSRNLATANAAAVLWAGAMFAWFFLSALYMQLILQYSPLQVGLAFLPSNIIMAVFSIFLSAKLVIKFGIKKPLAVGLILAGCGLFLFSLAPVGGSFLVHVLPGMLLLGIGAGMGFNPVLLAAMSDVPPEESGLASGLVNTSFMMGGALGLAVLVSVAAARSGHLVGHTTDRLVALNGGYQLAFAVGAGFAILAGLLSAWLLRIDNSQQPAAMH